MGDNNEKVGMELLAKDSLKQDLCHLNWIHDSKVILIEFHPSIAAIETKTKICSCDELNDACSFKWNKDRSRLVITAKDKKLRVFDPHNTEDAYEDTKSCGAF